MQVLVLGWGDTLEKEMATHSSILAWRIPWTEEPSRLQVHGVTKRQIHLNTHTHTHTHTRTHTNKKVTYKENARTKLVWHGHKEGEREREIRRIELKIQKQTTAPVVVCKYTQFKLFSTNMTLRKLNTQMQMNDSPTPHLVCVICSVVSNSTRCHGL